MTKELARGEFPAAHMCVCVCVSERESEVVTETEIRQCVWYPAI